MSTTMSKSEINNYIKKLEAIELKYKHLYTTFETHDDWVDFINNQAAN